MTTAIGCRLRWWIRRCVTSSSHLRTSSSFSCVRAVRRDGDLTETWPSFVHPTAIVHPNAVIEQGVSIGPFCTIGPSVHLGVGCRLYPGSHIFGNTRLGERCILMTGAVVGDDIPGSTFLGDDNIIGHHALVGVKCQDLKYKSGEECYLDIGDNNDIREFTTVHRSSKSNDRTVIGDHNFIMGSCHIAHDCKIGNHNIFANNTLLAGHVVVQDHVNTGGCTNIHQFCHICSYSFIGGGSVVSRDVPRYMMVAGERAEVRGLNMEGLKRRGFTSFQVSKLREAYRKLFVNGDVDDLGMEDRLLQLEKDEKLGEVPVVISMLKSIRDSIYGCNRRGICTVGCRRKRH